MPRRPEVYGELLRAKLDESGAQVWLINTGWTGGAYGVGRRISIAHTRTLLAAALGGALETIEFRRDAHFGLEVPVTVPGVPEDVLDPSKAWADDRAYAAAARALVARFAANFAAFAGSVGEDVRAAAIG